MHLYTCSHLHNTYDYAHTHTHRGWIIKIIFPPFATFPPLLKFQPFKGRQLAGFMLDWKSFTLSIPDCLLLLNIPFSQINCLQSESSDCGVEGVWFGLVLVKLVLDSVPCWTSFFCLQCLTWRKHSKQHSLYLYFICGYACVAWSKRETMVLNLGSTFMRFTITMWS